MTRNRRIYTLDLHDFGLNAIPYPRYVNGLILALLETFIDHSPYNPYLARIERGTQKMNEDLHTATLCTVMESVEGFEQVCPVHHNALLLETIAFLENVHEFLDNLPGNYMLMTRDYAPTHLTVVET